jgi:hypothetical protein
VSLKLHELLKGGFESGYDEGVLLETKGIGLSLEGKDPDWAIFFGGEASGRINAIPSVEELLEGIGEEAERVIAGLQGNLG